MVGLTSEITDKVTFGQRDHHLHLCPQMKHCDKVPCLRAQAGFERTFSNYESDTLATRPGVANPRLPSRMRLFAWFHAAL